MVRIGCAIEMVMHLLIIKVSVARVRVVRFTGLPNTSTPRTVAGLVFGGSLDRIIYEPGTSYAQVWFLNADDCYKFHSQTANGIECKWAEAHMRVVWVYLGTEVNPISGRLQEMIDRQNTRVVRVVGLTEGWTLATLKQFAEGMHISDVSENTQVLIIVYTGKGRKLVEHIEFSSRDHGGSIVSLQEIGRFASHAHSYQLRSELLLGTFAIFKMHMSSKPSLCTIPTSNIAISSSHQTHVQRRKSIASSSTKISRSATADWANPTSIGF